MKTSKEYAKLADWNLEQQEQYVIKGHPNLATMSNDTAQVYATLAQAAAVRELRETLEAEAERRDLLRARE